MNSAKVVSCLVGFLLVVSVLGGCGSESTGAFVSSDVSFQTDDSEITGTLVVPEGKGPFPAVIVIGGSGPFDRNGDMDAVVVEASKQAGQPVMMVSSTYRDIAEGLSRAGMVTLRYDKRGVGNSTGVGGDFPQPSLRDLEAAVTFLKDNPKVDAESIALVGHSLGGLWALMKAAEGLDIAAVCVMATPAKPYGEVIIEQLEGSAELLGESEASVALVVEQQRALYVQLRSGELDPATYPEPGRSQLEWVRVMVDVAGADYAKEIRSPVLILQGEKDLFTIIPGESQLLKDAFIEGGNEEVELISFPDLDHMFRLTPDQPSLQLYYEDRGPISPDVVDTIVDWMKDTLR